MRIASALPLVCTLCLLSPFLPQPARGETDSAYVRTHYIKTEYDVRMRDGVTLHTVVYSPGDTGRSYPILLIRTPYSAGPYDEGAYRTAMLPSMLLARSGYIFVYQDVRGRYLSGGAYVNVRPYVPLKKSKDRIDEASDAFDTIDWLVRTLRHHNGKVGMTGISYPGFYTSMGMIDAHPALVAASPQAPIADWFIGDDDHHNGALFLAETFNFFSGFGRPRPVPVRSHAGGFRHGSDDAYAFFLTMGPLANANARYFHDSIAYWNDLMAHPDYDAFWQERNILPHLRNIRPAVLVVGGWFDKEDLYGTLNTYKSLLVQSPSTRVALVMGPWAHGQWGRDRGERLGDIEFRSATSEWYRQAREFPFFEYWLKGSEEPPAREATVFLTGANLWHFMPVWPPPDTVRTPIYLRAGGGLSFSPPPVKSIPFTRYTSDPSRPVPHTSVRSISVQREYMVEDQRFLEQRPDVLTFATPPLKEPLTLAGPIEVRLDVATTGTDADWVVKVIDVFPADSAGRSLSGKALAGFQMLVRGDVMRGRYRNGYIRPEPFTPGSPTPVRFTLQDVFHRFGPGHRLMVQVQSSWFPLVDRNPQTFVTIPTARAEDFRTATQTVFHSPAHSSLLVLPVWGEHRRKENRP